MLHCTLCDQTVPAWHPDPSAAAPSDFLALTQAVGADLGACLCPCCGGNDRDRHAWLYLSRLGVPERLQGAAVLHIAPEQALERKLLSCQLGDYRRVALRSGRGDVLQVDLEHLACDDQHFDFIVCNHVLEHVAAPDRVMAELWRCLKPGGLLLAQTAYAPMLKTSFELKGAVPPELARLLYGHDGDVRLFGDDIADLFHSAGFEGALRPHEELLADVDAQAHGVDHREPLFLFFKSTQPLGQVVPPAALTNAQQKLQAQVDECKRRYGEWTYDIPLPQGVWTRGNLGVPHTRLRKLVQSAADLCGKPLAACRVLDLASLDGLFSIEFALQGAEVVGVEVREANIQKAIFCQQALGLQRLQFVQDDVRNLSEARYGRFDIIICSGILYHLLADDAIQLIETLRALCDRVVVIDTHIALAPKVKHVSRGRELYGVHFVEHDENDNQATRTARPWASADNSTSFWFTRPSLVNLMSDAGFSSVHECFTPAHLNFGKEGQQFNDRCTFVGLVAPTVPIIANPQVNALVERMPENALTYTPR